MERPLIILTGFSGAGKTTISQELINQHPDRLVKVITHTTRQPREGEQHGRDYHFLTLEDFIAKRDADHFLEHSQHYDHFYASPKPETLDLRPEQIPIYNLDTNGAEAIIQNYPNAQLFFVYISPEEQQRRLLARLEDPAKLASRILRYQEESKALEKLKDRYHVLRNEEVDDLQKAVDAVQRKMQI